ncbi:SRPBCC domain-containing protein [Parapedobacter lycopersici]|uniref:SRPBCC family protein n=1 Tax=Parapedobacter lycopersici TaxID=1864939 RepID=UPI00333F616E
MKPHDKELLISHLFDAPIGIVFDAWTDPEKLKHWYAPDGCTITYKTIEVKPGGRFHSCIHDPVHGECWIIGTYLEILPPEKLVFTMQLSDENGRHTNAQEAGKSADWPAEIRTTVTFKSVGNQTTATIHQTVSEAEAKKTGAYQSWIKMFNRLNRQLIAEI